MGGHSSFNKEYYLVSFTQIFSITVGVMISFLTLNNGILLPDPQQNSGTEGASSIVSFDPFIILFMVISLLFGAIIFYLIFTKLKSYGIRIIYGFVLGLPYLLLEYEAIVLALDSDLSLLRRAVLVTIAILLPIIFLWFMYVYISGELQITIRNIGLFISAIIIARMMALYFDLLTIVIFAIVLSLFDIYSVFKGPLAKIMGEPQKRDGNQEVNRDRRFLDHQFQKITSKGTPVILSYNNSVLGIGDVLFYGILMYQSMMEWSYLGLIFTFITILLGSLLTMYFLTKISPLPGLPIPVLFALLGYLTLYSLF